MADASESFPQAVLLPPLQIGHEAFGDMCSLMASSRYTTADLPKDECSNSLHSASRHEGNYKSSGEYSTAMSLTSTVEPSASTTCLSAPSYLKTSRKAKRSPSHNRRFGGWRMGVMIGCCVSFVVLGCNIAMIAVGVTSESGQRFAGIHTIFQSDEASVSRLNTALQILINILSTLSLSASNYTMQVLSSPTRTEVAAAHARGSWLDIGILSPRNLRAIARNRVVLWSALLLSSAPLHLFYNASVFKVRVSPTERLNPYEIIVMDVATKSWEDIRSATDDDLWTVGQYRNITAKQSDNLQSYMNYWPAEFGDLYIAIDQVNFDTESFPSDPRLLEIIAGLVANETVLNSTLEELFGMNWKPLTIKLSQWAWWKPEDTLFDGISARVVQMASKKRELYLSRVEVCVQFLIGVVCCNVLQLGLLLYVLITDRSAYLVTLGDAASSFMEHADPHTEGKCVLGRDEIIFGFGYPADHQHHDDEEKEAFGQRLEGQWRPHRHPYRQAVWFFLLCLLILITLMISTGPSWIANVTWKWGSQSTRYVYKSDSGTDATTLLSALLANVAQLLVTCCYFIVNRLCTSIAGMAEWSNYAVFRKGLRVTKPEGHQRSTYFLQLPYRWSVPLMATSATLHWLVSQTFFFVRVDDMETQTSTSACGFSFLGLLVLFVTFLGLLTGVCIVGYDVETAKAPLVASCSLAISAACHPAPDEVDAHLAKVKWGVTQSGVVEGVGHCSLSSKPVTPPEEGKLYY